MMMRMSISCVLGLLILLFIQQQQIQCYEASQYVGCFEDNNDRAMEEKVNVADTTIGRCIEQCRRLNKTFAGLQYSYNCFCGDTYDRYGLAEEQYCHFPCEGDSSETCGGSYRNSVYSVCPPGSYGDGCSEQCVTFTCQPQICLYQTGNCLYEPCDARHSYCHENCHTLKLDPRNEVGMLNTQPSIYFNLFANVPFPKSGSVRKIDFYAVQSGEVYVSFWRHIRNTYYGNKEWMLVGKILVHSSGPGAQSTTLAENERVYVQSGDVLAVHYTEGASGVIYYEDFNKPRTPGLNGSELTQTFYRIIIDEGWMKGQVITTYSYFTHRAVALHITLDCITECTHCQYGFCDPNSGRCTQCETGYIGERCERECEDGFHGGNCTQECSKHCKNTDMLCNKFSEVGECYGNSGCLPGYTGINCKMSCPDGYYGDNCTGMCVGHCLHPPCIKQSTDGSCLDNQCEAGYHSLRCDQECTPGHYGISCGGICSDYCQYPPCIATSLDGQCPQKACMSGYYGDHCKDASPPSPPGVNLGLIVSVVVGAIVVLVCAIVAAFCIVRRRKSGDSKSSKGEERGIMMEVKQSTLSLDDIDLPNEGTDMDKNNIDGGLYANDYISPTAVKVGELYSHIAKVRATKDGFEEEFKKLPNCTSSTGEASLPELRVKNRYKNILPYEHNRVVLSRQGDDLLSEYINANFIKDYHENQAYIAGLAPTELTLVDFWRMIWEQNVHSVFMLTKLAEMGKVKSELYWPKDEDVTFGEISVSKKQEQTGPVYVTRILVVTKGDETRTVTQHQYTQWPDKSVPVNVGGILSLRTLLKSYRTKDIDQPILVHCSAGVGRTGTFVALDILLEQSEQRGFVDVFQCVKKLRSQRMYMVQTQIQYSFLYTALSEILTVGVTTIPCAELLSRLDKMASEYTVQYNYLEKQRTKKEVPKANDVVKEYTDDDLTRSSEVPSHFRTVRVKGYSPDVCYITAPLPSPDQICSLWGLVYNEKMSTVVCLEDSDTQWLPTVDDQLTIDGLYDVQCIQCTDHKEGGVEERDISVSVCGDVYANVDSTDKNVHTMKVLMVVNTEKFDSSESLQSLITLHTESKHSRTGDSKGVLVICRDGVTRCGVYLTSCILMDMADTEQQIDVYYTVSKVRKAWQHFIDSLEQYILLHRVVERYIQQFEEYSNFK